MWPSGKVDKVISFLWFCGLGIFISAFAAVI